MQKTDVLVIGGGPAGIIVAVTAKVNYPDKKVTLVRTEEQVLVPCGIPYIFGTLEDSSKNIVPDAALTNAGVELKVDEVVVVDRAKKVASLADGGSIQFDKLVFATGSTAYMPQWLKGADLENVFTVQKNKVYLDKARQKLQELDKIAIVGAGFIGVEIADELAKIGKKVTIVEKLPSVLPLAFDKEITSDAGTLLSSRGVTLKTGVGVKEVLGNGTVTGVLLENGEELEAEAIILAMGYRPNSTLAKKTGLRIGHKNAIWVDEYMRTDDSDVFAIGDCAERKSFITRKLTEIMLASTAVSEARIAGANLYKLQVVKTFSGTIGIFSTAIGDTAFGSAGLTEWQAKQEGFDIVSATFESVDKHPGTLPGAHKQRVKLIAARKSGVLIGGQAMGGNTAGEVMNIIGLAIQTRTTVDNLLTAQIGTHPLLTSAPTTYPIVKAAEKIVAMRS